MTTKTLDEQLYELEERYGLTHNPQEIQDLAEAVAHLQD